jgi:hypothetical protein
MVHLRAGIKPAEVRGTLSLGDRDLEFTGHKTGEDVRFGYDSILRAKRIRGSPVLLVDWREGDAHRRTAFYFSQPPPLEEPERSPTLVPRGALGPFTRGTPSRRQVAKRNLGYLRSTSVATRDVMRAWTRAIAERAGGTS